MHVNNLYKRRTKYMIEILNNWKKIKRYGGEWLSHLRIKKNKYILTVHTHNY